VLRKFKLLHHQVVLLKSAPAVHALDAMQAFVGEVCQSETSGARIVVSKTGCVVLDVQCWTDEMSECIRERFGPCTISIVQSQSSASGFCVVIQLEGGPPGFVSQACPVVASVLLLVASACVLWWSAYHHMGFA